MSVDALKQRVEEQREAILGLLRELVAIPSCGGQLEEVGERAMAEMKALGFQEVRFDRMGNVLGRLGDGPKKLVYDSHLDTVGIGDPDAWAWDPFEGKVEDGILYARGAGDEKASTPGMIHGLALAQELGYLEGWTAWYFGNMEEWCDGIAPNTFVEVDPKVRPDFVVIGEPTRLHVYRGQKGRVEMQVVAKGKSAHAAANHLGDNALYKLIPVLEGVKNLEPELGDDPFLGHGKITATQLEVKTPSINAVPDEAVLYIDRRLTAGEDREAAIEQVRQLIPAELRGTVKVEMLHQAEPSYTGFVYEVEKYFPAWITEEEHPLVQAGQAAIRELWGDERPTGKWNFSTNGIYWAGKARIPSIGFGPGDEVHAHTVLDQVPLEEVVQATAWYALLPALVQA